MARFRFPASAPPVVAVRRGVAGAVRRAPPRLRAVVGGMDPLRRRLVCVCSAAALGLAPLAGCTTEQGRISLAAIEPVQLDVRQLEVEKLPAMRDVEGSATGITSILFFPTFTEPQLSAAVEDALAAGRGDILTRAQVTTTRWWFLVGVETLRVRGNVIDLPETP